MKRRPKKAARYYEGSRPEVTTLLPVGCRRVLEVGCGTGGFRENLPADCEYWGIEPATGPAAEAATRLDRVLTVLFSNNSQLKETRQVARATPNWLDPMRVLRAIKIIHRHANRKRFDSPRNTKTFETAPAFRPSCDHCARFNAIS